MSQRDSYERTYERTAPEARPADAERLEFVSAVQNSVTDLAQQYALIRMYDAALLRAAPRELSGEDVRRALYASRYDEGVGNVADLTSALNAALRERP